MVRRTVGAALVVATQVVWTTIAFHGPASFYALRHDLLSRTTSTTTRQDEEAGSGRNRDCYYSLGTQRRNVNRLGRTRRFSSRQQQQQQKKRRQAANRRRRQKKRGFGNSQKTPQTYSARFLEDNGLVISTDPDGTVVARPRDAMQEKQPSCSSPNHQQQQQQQHTQQPKPKPAVVEQPARPVPQTGFNVVLTHCTADFDSLASAVGLAKLWSAEALETPCPVCQEEEKKNTTTNNSRKKSSVGEEKSFDSASHVPTFVVLPRGAHPGVQRFLALHKHLFPIRSLRSLPSDLSGLNRLALVDAQRRDRIGPAEPLLQHANRVTVVDHHIDQDSDIGADDYVVDQVGSVTTLMSERLQQAGVELSAAEATLLALGVHADTGSLCFDSTTPRDAHALAWCLEQGASQAAIAEHAQSSLSTEQQEVLTQALMNANSTRIHGVTLSTALLSADRFINGLAAVTQDALDLSSSDVFLLGLVYEAQSGGRRRSKKRKLETGRLLTSRLLSSISASTSSLSSSSSLAAASASSSTTTADMGGAFPSHYWQEGAEATKRRQLLAAFRRTDRDGSGTLDHAELLATFKSMGVIVSPESVADLMESIDTDGNGTIDLEEFVQFALAADQPQQAVHGGVSANHAGKQNGDDKKKKNNNSSSTNTKSTTLIVIGRVKAGVNMKAVKLNKLLEPFGGGGHAKAASATMRLNDPSDADGVLQGLVDDLVTSSLQQQPTVGDFMTSPVLSVQPTMTEKQVEDLFTRYDVRALPVVDDVNDVIGLVTYKEVAAAKQRLWNKEQKRLRRERQLAEQQKKQQEEGGQTTTNPAAVHPRHNARSAQEQRAVQQERKQGTTVKGWMKQHVQLVEASKTMAEVESILLENDVGCIPVVADGTKQLVGMVTRTDLLRQHRYYPSLPYHNKGFADSIAARKPIIELRKKLKRFDID